MTIEDIKNAVLEIVELYPISRVTLFGSRANGSARPDSDVDFIIEFNKPVTLITISQITQTLENLLQTNVDVIHGPVRETDLLEIDEEVELYAA
ncbi:MAG: nucleotidyltransferase domain-containing protein [Thermoguttaceae bacterium]|jgi:predicted nucleotidyltransferase|nr:nucleotidyltransferase domain-containing protein [Thermoguttaceae bacterium]